MKVLLLIPVLLFLSAGCRSKDTSYRPAREDGSTAPPSENPSGRGGSELSEAQKKELPQIIEIPVIHVRENLKRIKNLSEWNSVSEGFRSSYAYQVKVTSLKSDPELALKEAVDVAKRKSVKMLIAEAIPGLSNDSKTDIKILVEEYGKIVADSDFFDNKHHFVFLILKPGLETIIKEKLK